MSYFAPFALTPLGRKVVAKINVTLTGVLPVMTIVQSPQSWIKQTFFIGVIAALTACGGSGGGSNPPPGTPPDTTPNAFTIPAAAEVEPGNEVVSETVTIRGINAPTPISIIGGEYSIGGREYTSEAGTINNNQSVTVKVLAPEAYNETAEATLTIGGVSAIFSVSTIIDNTPPSVTITFPPAVSLTEGTTILVRGTASDELHAVESVEVGGFPATSEDGYATWVAEVTLEPGVDNILSVTARDSVGSEGDNLASVTVHHSADLNIAFPNDQLEFSEPQTVAVDAERNRALVVDVEQRAVFTVDLLTGTRSILSSNIKPDDTFPFAFNHEDYNGAGIAVDPFTDVAYVGNDVSPYILVIDLETGSREGYPGNYTPYPTELVVEKTDSNHRLFVAEASGGGVYLQELGFTQGEKLISWSGGDIPNRLNPISNIGGITIDSTRDRALVTTLSGPQYVLAIDLTDESLGKRTLFSDANTPNTDNPFSASGDFVLTSITTDVENDRALMVDRGSKTIFSLALENGARTIFSSNVLPNNSNLLLDPFSVHVEEGFSYALVVDKKRKALIAIDLVDGQRVILSKSATSASN